ncbi:hypothetical protein CL643_00485 [bacterium]|nr:hypothetical protein [bacterium]|tara:strand:- start:7003 stop:7266 length:264 start_codon:yes stop_codon:yes gene_type:complete
MNDLFDILQNYSIGLPREWVELIIIAILGFIFTIIYRTSKIFMKVTIWLTVVGVIFLSIYSLLQKNKLIEQDSVSLEQSMPEPASDR